jgi:hypothetical protein
MNSVANILRLPTVGHMEVRSGMLRGFGIRHLALAVLFTLFYNVLGQLGWLDFGVASFASRLRKFVDMPAHFAICAIALLAAVSAENTITGKRLSALRYPLAVLAGAIIGALIFEMPLLHPPRPGDLVSGNVNSAFAERLRLLLPSFLKATYLSLLVVTLHAVFEANRRAAAALHAARIRALDAEKEVFEGELRAMQTRVDPDLLFDSLKDIDAAYATNPESGQSRLDALIRFLRAALPGRSTAIPTVAHEKELTEAYVALMAIRHATQPRLEFLADTVALGENMPPMLLLPLVKWASDFGLADELRVGVRCLESDPIHSGPCLELSIDSRLNRAPDGDGEELEILRYRLQRLHGEGAHLVATSAGMQRHAVIVLPLGAGN